MTCKDYSQFASLSPFELKDKLIEIATEDSQKVMLNAGRGNPNFLATLPRRAFLSLGDFALREAERSYSFLNSGFGGLPEREGIALRFEFYANERKDDCGVRFLRSAVSYVKDQLGLCRDSFLHEMVGAFLGCNYPVPPRMLENAEAVVSAYLRREMFGKVPCTGPFSLFATEGGTAAMTYTFQTLRENGLLKPGDKIALGTPIFSPYLEIPVLSDFGLTVVDVRMDEDQDWQYTESELLKLEDPAVKAFFIVNPSNPPSTRMSDRVLDRLAKLINEKRRDLFVLTDDVYGTFADDFVSVFAKCPRNTICVYSFSKYFGATGWRLGVIAVHKDNVMDEALDALPEEVKKGLDERYSSLSTTPRDIRFIDRLVADSRTVALNHTAGLSLPQQLQMTLFALNGLMDSEDYYKKNAKWLIRDRYATLCRNMGVETVIGPEEVDYYNLIDLQELGQKLYGDKFAEWFCKENKGTDFLFRLAEETGVVLLPGAGFEVVHPSARVSLANLTHVDYAAIGRFTRKVLDEYYEDFVKSGS